MEILTKKLNNGIEVLAKMYEGEPSAMTYANRTQAERKASEMGNGWMVYHIGRPFYVGRIKMEVRNIEEVTRLAELAEFQRQASGRLFL